MHSYLEQVPGGRPHIPVDRRAPAADFTVVAARYPIFRVVPDPSATGLVAQSRAVTRPGDARSAKSYGSAQARARTARGPGQETEPGGPGVPGIDDRGACQQVVQRAAVTLHEDADEAQAAQDDAERENE